MHYHRALALAAILSAAPLAAQRSAPAGVTAARPRVAAPAPAGAAPVAVGGRARRVGLSALVGAAVGGAAGYAAVSAACAACDDPAPLYAGAGLGALAGAAVGALVGAAAGAPPAGWARRARCLAMRCSRPALGSIMVDRPPPVSHNRVSLARRLEAGG